MHFKNGKNIIYNDDSKYDIKFQRKKIQYYLYTKCLRQKPALFILP